MTWGAVAVGVAGVAGAALSADAAGKAADQQSASADRASGLSREAQQQMRRDLSPWVSTGEAANNALADYLGLGAYGYVSPSQIKFDNPLAQEGFMRLLNDPTNRVSGNAQAVAEQLKAGWGGQPYTITPSPASTGGMNLLTPFTGKDLANEPGYQFGLNEGNNALLNRQANSGGMFSGNALRAASQFNQDYAGTKFDAAYNRDAANKQRIYNFLKGSSDTGQAAAAGVASANNATAALIGNNTMAAGNAQAAGTVGAANAWGGALGTIYNNYQQQNALQAYNNRTNAMLDQPSTSANGTYYGSGFVGPRLA